MNQCLYEREAKDVEQMTRDALAEGRPPPEVLIAARAMKAGWP